MIHSDEMSTVLDISEIDIADAIAAIKASSIAISLKTSPVTGVPGAGALIRRATDVRSLTVV